MNRWVVFIAAFSVLQYSWAEDMQATLQWSQRVELSTAMSGIVRVVNVGVGEFVKKGQILLSLDDEIYRAKVAEGNAEITRLKAEAEEDGRELQRVMELHERTVVATTELDQAKLRKIRSKSALTEAQARLKLNQKKLDDTSIRAPFDSMVILRNAEPGMSVSSELQTQMLLTLARAGEMIARMQLASSQIDKLKLGQVVTVNVAGKSYTGNVKTIAMEPSSIGNESTYAVDVLFSTGVLLRAGKAVIVKLP